MEAMMTAEGVNGQRDREGGRVTRAAAVLGARNLGAAITRDLLTHGTRVATIARTEADLDALQGEGALPLGADASDREQIEDGLSQATRKLGSLDLIVDAISAARPPADGSGFGGGPLASASMAGFEGWTVAVARQAFVPLQAGLRALEGSGGTFVEIVGAPARRADPGRGLIAAGSAAVRALTHAAAQEMRESGVHVALLIVDGIIESPKTAQMTRGMPPAALVRQQDVAEAVRFLAAQPDGGLTHELVITPIGTRWAP